MPRGSDTDTNFTLKGNFYNIENTKNKMLEINPNLERHMTTYQAIESVSFRVRRRQTVLTTLGKVFTKK